MKKITIFYIIIFLCLLGIIIFLANAWISTSMELKNVKSIIKAQDGDSKAMAFLKLFINDVLMSKDPVPFEERLKLENSVREIKDQEIFNQWQTFLKAKSGETLQTEAKKLLQLLLVKIEK